MFTRWLVIILSFAAALYRVSHGAFVEAAGLAALGAGLLLLKANRPERRTSIPAWLCFAITIASMAIVLVRDRL